MKRSSYITEKSGGCVKTVKSSPHTLGRARERYVMQKYKEHGWNASLTPGSAWGAKHANVQPVDIKAYKLTKMTQKDWNDFFQTHDKLVSAMTDVSGKKFKGLLKGFLESFLEWKQERDRRNTIKHYVQVKKDKNWLTDEEKNELIRLSERDGAVPVFVYSYVKNKRLHRYRFENLKTGVEFSDNELG